MKFKEIDEACDWLSKNAKNYVWMDTKDLVCGIAIEGLVKHFRQAMEEMSLKEAGWIPVKERIPPFGVKVNVCIARSNGQSIWQQTFRSDEEVKESGITHWAYAKT